jgi:hypothetical protein
MRPYTLSSLVVLALVACASTEMPDLTSDVDPTKPAVVDEDQTGARVALPGPGAPGTPGTPGEDGGTSGTADDASSPPPAPGPLEKAGPNDLTVTEIMFDPTGMQPEGEWFEIYNGANGPRDLEGLVIGDGSHRTHTIRAKTIIPAGGYGVFVRNETTATADGVPAGLIVYEYGRGQSSSEGVQFSNGSTGALTIKSGGTVYAEADYGGWFGSADGRSLQLKTLGSTGSSSSHWCISSNTWGPSTDRGTPGEANDCP